MVTRDTVWPEGTPCWIDVTVPDVDLAREFYSGLFGWDIPEASPQSRGYRIASLGGKIVAGIRPLAGPIEPAWNTYLAAQDADLAAAKAEPAGGRLVMGPVDVMTEEGSPLPRTPQARCSASGKAGSGPGSSAPTSQGR